MTENAGRYGAGRILDQKAEVSNFAPFGYLWHNNDTRPTALTVSLTIANTPVISTGWEISKVKSSTDYLTLDGANGLITIGPKGRGIYTVKICTSFSSSKNNISIHGEVFITPSGGSASLVEEVVWERFIRNVGDVGDARRDNEVLLLPGDVLDYRFNATGVPATITVRHGSFGIKWYSGG